MLTVAAAGGSICCVHLFACVARLNGGYGSSASCWPYVGLPRGPPRVGYILPGFVFFKRLEGKGGALKRVAALALSIAGRCSIIPTALTVIFLWTLVVTGNQFYM